MNIETGKWFAYDYEIIELPDNNGPVKVIVAMDTPRERIYDPLTLGSNVEYEGYGKIPYQPKEPGIGNYQPHIELARLDLSNENEILKFTYEFGLLGLWLISDSNRVYDEEAYKRLQESLIPSRKYLLNGYRAHFEFLADFKYAAEQYQKAYGILCTIQEAKTKGYDPELHGEFSLITQPYLKDVHPLADYDIETGSLKMIWLFPGLLNCCYFRLIQDIRGNRFAQCDFKKCNRPFLAKTKDDNYCSAVCRRKGTMANLAIRKVKNELRDMQEEGEISKELRWAAGKKAQELYDNGIRDYDELFKRTKSFIKRKSQKEG